MTPSELVEKIKTAPCPYDEQPCRTDCTCLLDLLVQHLEPERVGEPSGKVMEEILGSIHPPRRPARKKGDPSYTKGRRLHKWGTRYVPDQSHPGVPDVLTLYCVREGCGQTKLKIDEKVPDCQGER